MTALLGLPVAREVAATLLDAERDLAERGGRDPQRRARARSPSCCAS